MHMDVESRRTVRLSGELTGVNRPPARCEDVIFVTSTFHMSMESSFETQFKVVLLKTDPEHHFPDPHSFKLSNRTDNLHLAGELRGSVEKRACVRKPAEVGAGDKDVVQLVLQLGAWEEARKCQNGFVRLHALSPVAVRFTVTDRRGAHRASWNGLNAVDHGMGLQKRIHSR